MLKIKLLKAFWAEDNANLVAWAYVHTWGWLIRLKLVCFGLYVWSKIPSKGLNEFYLVFPV